MQHRLLTDELMDSPGLDPALHEQALRGLRRLNFVSHAAAPVRRAASNMLHRADVPAHYASVLDVATGGGDLLLALARTGIGKSLHGVDRSSTALGIARQRAESFKLRADWHCVDVLQQPLPFDDDSIDLVVCSLFLHHLTGPEVARLLAEMARVARVGVVVSDLRRSTYGLTIAAIAARVATRSRIVHVDSVKSVRAAWTLEELTELAQQA